MQKKYKNTLSFLEFTPTKSEMKELAKVVKRLSLKYEKIKIKHSEALELIAHTFGYKDWNTAIAMSNSQKEKLLSSIYRLVPIEVFKKLYGYDYRFSNVRSLENFTLPILQETVVSRGFVAHNKVERNIFSRDISKTIKLIPEALRRGRFDREMMNTFNTYSMIRTLASIFKIMKPTFVFTGVVKSGKTYALLGELQLMKGYLNIDKTLVVCNKEEMMHFTRILPKATILSHKEYVLTQTSKTLSKYHHIVIDEIYHLFFSSDDRIQLKNKETLFITSQDKEVVFNFLSTLY